jgi:hypothetical protein
MNGPFAMTTAAHHERGGKTLAEWFILTAGGVLAVTGAAKIWTGLGDSKFLAVVDPIIGVKFGPLMLAVGMAEIAVALVCFLSKRQGLALGLVAWLATNFLVYRVGLGWMDWHRPCNCLGNLTDALHISPQAADNVMKVILAYLLVGSLGLLIWRWPAVFLIREKEVHGQETTP